MPATDMTRAQQEDDILDAARQLFGSERAARAWLEAELPALGFRKPLTVMRERGGLAKVRDLLGRIEYGVYS